MQNLQQNLRQLQSQLKEQTYGITALKPFSQMDSVVPYCNIFIGKKVVKTAVFVGDKGAGKSTLVQAFLNQSGKKESSSPLEYYFGRKPSVVDSSKDLAHIYEVGGGKSFSNLIHIPIGLEQYQNTVLVIVLDLSQLSTLLDTLSFWLEAIRQEFSVFESAELTLQEDSLKSMHSKLWTLHGDGKYLNPTPVPVLVVANKYDLFIREAP